MLDSGFVDSRIFGETIRDPSSPLSLHDYLLCGASSLSLVDVLSGVYECQSVSVFYIFHQFSVRCFLFSFALENDDTRNIFTLLQTTHFVSVISFFFVFHAFPPLWEKCPSLETISSARQRRNRRNNITHVSIIYSRVDQSSLPTITIIVCISIEGNSLEDFV